jgi:hypothetical protein
MIVLQYGDPRRPTESTKLIAQGDNSIPIEVRENADYQICGVNFFDLFLCLLRDGVNFHSSVLCLSIQQLNSMFSLPSNPLCGGSQL